MVSMGYYTVTAPCCNCKNIFSFHPNKVPSIRINGIREPICKTCVDRSNVERKEKGMPLITYTSDAYQVVHDENEMNW